MFSRPDVIEAMKAKISVYVQRALMSLIVAGAVLGTASSVRADPVPLGSWQEFRFGVPGSFAGECNVNLCVPSISGNTQFAPVPPWTFTLGPGGGLFTITDAFAIGDAFDVFDFGILIGSTPSVAPGGGCPTDPVPCLADPTVSHAVFSLTEGNHSITIIARDSPFNTGAAYFRVDPVPEPATMILLGTGLIGIASAVRQRRLKK